ncbi:MAG: hypothetical protein JWQ48_2167 [Conexibacter sp.]|jgi:hypothetical protein|nr:hypothetical protein [Conexibacter sp.]
MTVQHVEVLTGGNAQWGTPVRCDETKLQTAYEAALMNRFTLANGQVHYLRLRIVGIDEIDNDGEVPYGSGALEFQDADGDKMRGRVEWLRPEEIYLGTWTIASGTGKWTGANGTIELLLNGMHEDPQDGPPTGPTRYWGFLEGSGQLELPAIVG